MNVEDLRRLARRRLPAAIFDYIDGGADGEVTLRDNRRVWDEVFFRPRNAVMTPECDTRTTVLGCQLAAPILLAPLGYTRLFHREGELGAAKAARAAGLGYVMSTFSGYTVEEVGAASEGPLWFQLYIPGGQAAIEGTLQRAWKAGFRVLAVTIDTNGPGMRERDLRNGAPQLMGTNLLAKLPYVPQLLGHPGWLADHFADRASVMTFPNVVIPNQGPLRAEDVRTMLAQSVISWADMRWIRKAWPGAVVMKGVITAEDARRSVDEGAAGVIVSNHGGRQLDTCLPSLRALPEVVKAVGDQVEVLVDGGIRRGSDIAKAICMGAKAVLVGRAYGYGLAAAGEKGVAKAISILQADLVRTLILLGCARTQDLNQSYVKVPDGW